MIERVKIRKRYEEELGKSWKMLYLKAQPTIDYVKWLEDELANQKNAL